MKRMDRYFEEDSSNRVTRSNKNQDLYQNIGRNSRYTNFTDVTNTNAYEINTSHNSNRNMSSREDYQRMREYKDFIPGPKVKRELEEFKNVYKEKENRVYDINSVIAEARKNRKDDSSKEAKRKLKNDTYNILMNLNKEELEEYRKQRKEKYTHPDEEELHEIFDTIASKTLAGELDKDTTVNLLSELVATSLLDKVEMPSENNEETDSEIEEAISEESKDSSSTSDIAKNLTSSEVVDKEQIEMIKAKLEKQDDKKSKMPEGAYEDFYTRSMDLTGEDFEMDDEFKEKGMPTGLKVLITLIILIVLSVAGYMIWQMYK